MHRIQGHMPHGGTGKGAALSHAGEKAVGDDIYMAIFPAEGLHEPQHGILYAEDLRAAFEQQFSRRHRGVQNALILIHPIPPSLRGPFRVSQIPKRIIADKRA